MTAPFSECHQPADTKAASRAVSIPELLLPNQSVDRHLWPVIACDQHTSEPDYWAQTDQLTRGHPSTFQMILPEVFLDQLSPEEMADRIKTIHQTMYGYLNDSILESPGPGCILVERKTPQHAQRLGLVLTIDLEHYDYRPGSQSLIRATEETVEARIPPRMAIRKDAPIELSHVLALIDDPSQTIIEPLYHMVNQSSQEPCYETELIQDGGLIRGWFLPEGSRHLQQALNSLSLLDSMKKYNLQMAVGDGNHSLATAKAHWNQLKDSVPFDHPARYAMVEIINLYDDGLTFEPIHRVVTGLQPDVFYQRMLDWFASSNAELVLQNDQARQSKKRLLATVLLQDGAYDLLTDPGGGDLPTALVQSFLDHLSNSQSCRIDYIHGTDVLRKLAAEGAVGLVMPPMRKEVLFPYIATNSLLPRKTFSLGSANEKRYYMECRLIEMNRV